MKQKVKLSLRDFLMLTGGKDSAINKAMKDVLLDGASVASASRKHGAKSISVYVAHKSVLKKYEKAIWRLGAENPADNEWLKTYQDRSNPVYAWVCNTQDQTEERKNKRILLADMGEKVLDYRFICVGFHDEVRYLKGETFSTEEWHFAEIIEGPQYRPLENIDELLDLLGIKIKISSIAIPILINKGGCISEMLWCFSNKTDWDDIFKNGKLTDGRTIGIQIK